jgi:hypothetical protein
MMLKLFLKYFLIHVLTFLEICFGHKINNINVEILIKILFNSISCLVLSTTRMVCLEFFFLFNIADRMVIL